MPESFPKTQLELQIEQERLELAAVPKIPIEAFMGGPRIRCHIKGELHPIEALKPFDLHIPSAQVRYACPDCHPNRGKLAGKK